MGVSYYFCWTFNHCGDLILHKTYPYKQIDYLYVDMNCEIHPAVKADPNMTISDMYKASIDYLDKIVNVSNPKKGIFLAIDGVAPRAKMNQQRMRRYKSIQDKKTQHEIKIKHGKDVTNNEVDFNMISPGTEFMVTLASHLREHIKMKMKTDWAGLEVTLSDASIPGEGEHKIMNHIRKELPIGYRPAIYGLDSDLIFLGLINYRPETVLVRETIEFNTGRGPKGKRGQESKEVKEEIDFTFLTIDDLRNIITKILSPIISLSELEQFGIINNVNIPGMPLNPKLSYYNGTDSDKHRLVMDYAFFCFMLGNDFLPYLPSLRIRDGGLEIAMLAYKSVSWRVGTYLVNSDGITINEQFFQLMLEEFAYIEDAYLRELGKSRKIRICKILGRINRLPDYEREVELNKYLEHQVRDTLQLGYDKWKIRYYHDQFHIRYRHKNEFAKQIKPICHAYLEGMKWTLLYYQGKHDNWTWYYNYDAAPSVSDLLVNLESFKFNDYVIEKNVPVTPFVQLMSILPPESAHLLPDELNQLMMSQSSSIHYMYPLKVKLNKPSYKKFLWECHPMLPEIDFNILERLVDHYSHEFSKRDKIRNTNNVSDLLFK